MCPPTRIAEKPQGFTMTNEEWQAKLAELRAALSSPRTVLVVERELHKEGHDGCFSSSYLVPEEKLTLLLGATIAEHDWLNYEKAVEEGDPLGHNIRLDAMFKPNVKMISTTDLAKIVSGETSRETLHPGVHPGWWFGPAHQLPLEDVDFGEIVEHFRRDTLPLLEVLIEEEIADWLAYQQDVRLVSVLEMFRTLSVPAPRSEKLYRRLPFVIARLDRMRKAEAERVTEARLALDKATKHLAEKNKLDGEEARLKRTAERIGLLSGLDA